MLNHDPRSGDMTLISGGGDGRVYFWNVSDLEVNTDATEPITEPPAGSVRSEREDWPVMALHQVPVTDQDRANPSIVRVDAAYADGSVRRWECANRRLQVGAVNAEGAWLATEIEELVAVFEEEGAAQEQAPTPGQPKISHAAGFGLSTTALSRQPSLISVALLDGAVVEASRLHVAFRPRQTNVSVDGGAQIGEKGWALPSAFTVTCLAANERRIVVAGVAGEGLHVDTHTTSPLAVLPANFRSGQGVVAVLSRSGELCHISSVPSSVLTMTMADDRLYLGCKDAVRYVDYSVCTPPPELVPNNSVSLGRRQALPKVARMRAFVPHFFGAAAVVAVFAIWIAVGEHGLARMSMALGGGGA